MAYTPPLPHAGEALAQALPDLNLPAPLLDTSREAYLRLHAKFSLVVRALAGPAASLLEGEQLLVSRHALADSSITVACAQAPIDPTLKKEVPAATRWQSRSLTITTPRLSPQTGLQSLMFHAIHLNNGQRAGDDNCLDEAANSYRKHRVLFQAPNQFPTILGIIGLDRDDPHIQTARHLGGHPCPVTTAIPSEKPHLAGFRGFGDDFTANRGIGVGIEVGIALLQHLHGQKAAPVSNQSSPSA